MKLVAKTLGLSMILLACGENQSSRLKEVMNEYNQPKWIPGNDGPLEINYYKLPKSGSSKNIVWTGNWYPYSNGGTVKIMEKYDRATNNNNKATNWEKSEVVKYKNSNWAGHCNGLAAASTMTKEPLNAVTLNYVTFTPGDIKGLLTELWQGGGYIVGERCDKNTVTYDNFGRIVTSDCRDTNPATFHIAITNFLGIWGKPIISDMDFKAPVWNYPIINYKVNWEKELTNEEANHWLTNQEGIYSYNSKAVAFMYVQILTIYQKYEKYEQPYEYILELDQDGNILGGEWVGRSKNEHPDFIWRHTTPQPENPFIDPKIIDSIYRASI